MIHIFLLEYDISHIIINYSKKITFVLSNSQVYSYFQLIYALLSLCITLYHYNPKTKTPLYSQNYFISIIYLIIFITKTMPKNIISLLKTNSNSIKHKTRFVFKNALLSSPNKQALHRVYMYMYNTRVIPMNLKLPGQLVTLLDLTSGVQSRGVARGKIANMCL